jgi:hypothetical protein
MCCIPWFRKGNFKTGKTENATGDFWLEVPAFAKIEPKAKRIYLRRFQIRSLSPQFASPATAIAFL